MNKKKIFAILTLVCFMFTLMPMATFAADTDESVRIEMQIGSYYVTVNGETFRNDVAPKIVGERTMLPIRVVAEALGADVAWDGEQQKVTITKGDTVIEVFIGKDYAMVNGEKVALDVPAFIENGRTYLPIRFVSEHLGANVEWDADSRSVIITTGDEAADTVTVSFDYNYGDKGIYTTVEAEKGEKVTRPESPYRSGYVFNGWYTSEDTEDDELFDFYSDKVYADMTLYGRWTAQSSGGGSYSGGGHTHNYTSEITMEASCTTAGMLTYTCSCGQTETESIEALGHKMVKGDKVEGNACSGEVYVWICQREGCDYSEQRAENPSEHIWDDGVVTTPATCTAKGVMTYTCTVCSLTRTEDIDITNHTYIEGSLKTADTDAVIGTRCVCDCGDIKDIVTETSSVVATIGTDYFATIDGAISAAKADDVVNVKAGSYTLPQFVTDNISIVAEEGATVDFNLTKTEGEFYRINTNGAKFVGVEFNNPVCLTGSATFENCNFSEGTDTWTINGDTSLIGCTVANNGDDTTPGFSLHIDSGDGTGVVTIEDTKFTGGAVAFKGIKSISFTECNFGGTYGWKYMRAYAPTTLTDCTFTATTSSSTLATVKAVDGAFNAVTRNNTDVVVEYDLPQFVDNDAVIGQKGYKTVVTLKKAEGDWYRINTNGARFVGVEFNNPVCLTGSAVFEDCNFNNGTTTWTINGDTSLIGCTVANNGEGFSLHIDYGDGTGVVTIEETEFTGGAVAFKGIKSISFTKCNFGGTYGWKYMRAYAPTTLTNCTFADGMTVKAAQGAVDNVTLVNTTVTVE